MSYFGIDRIFQVLKTIKQYGGLKASLYKIYRSVWHYVITIPISNSFLQDGLTETGHFSGNGQIRKQILRKQILLLWKKPLG